MFKFNSTLEHALCSVSSFIYLHTIRNEVFFWGCTVLFCFLVVDGVFGSCWLFQFCIVASFYQNRLCYKTLLGEECRTIFLGSLSIATVNSLDCMRKTGLLSQCCFLLFFYCSFRCNAFSFFLFFSFFLVHFYFSFPFWMFVM